jgi:predicted Zn-dependent protease
VWGPLLDLRRRQGDRAALETLIAETIEVASDPHLRATLRMERAKLLLDAADRMDDAIDALRDLLAEEPGHHETAELLLDVYARAGRTDERPAIASGSPRSRCSSAASWVRSTTRRLARRPAESSATRSRSPKPTAR